MLSSSHSNEYIFLHVLLVPLFFLSSSFPNSSHPHSLYVLIALTHIVQSSVCLCSICSYSCVSVSFPNRFYLIRNLKLMFCLFFHFFHFCVFRLKNKEEDTSASGQSITQLFELLSSFVLFFFSPPKHFLHCCTFHLIIIILANLVLSLTTTSCFSLFNRTQYSYHSIVLCSIINSSILHSSRLQHE